MQKSILARAAELACGVKFEDLPPKLVDLAKTALIDYAGVCVAGSSEPSAKAALRYCLQNSVKKEASVFGSGETADAKYAAFANAVSAHALDFDDVSWSTIGHPTCVIAPVCFALCEKLNLSGKKLILAYCAGVEVMHELARLAMPSVSQNGWHTTSVFGIFGAAVAGAKLLGLDAKSLTPALALAVSKASGVRANFGSSAKHYHAGMAVLGGLDALELALCGFSANEYAFEASESFLQIYGDVATNSQNFSGSNLTNDAELRANLDRNKYPNYGLNFGKPWNLLQNGLVFKRYPSCSGSHPAIDLALDLRREHGIRAAEIKFVKIGCSLLAPKELVCDVPANATEAKFSMKFAVAAALYRGAAGLAEFLAESVNDATIRDLMCKISVSVDEEFAALGFIGTSPAKIEIELLSGEKIVGKNMLAKGNPQKPLGEAEFRDKFYSCTANLAQRERLCELLSRIDELSNLSEVSEICKQTR